MPSIESMRANLNKLEEAKSAPSEPNTPKVYKPSDPQEVNLNTIKVGEEVKIRFVQDGDTSNDFFWRAYSYHDLWFRGVKGDDSKADTITVVRVPAYNTTVDKFGKIARTDDALLNVPQASVYTNMQDPIQQYSSKNKLFEQTDRVVTDINGNEIMLYKALKRKIEYLTQGYIVQAPESLVVYPEARPLKHFRMKPTIIDRITDFIMDEENVKLGDDPINNDNGVDYNYRKSLKGEFNNYDTSGFARIHTKLTDEARADFERYGADFIGDRVPKAPNSEQIAIISQMLEAFIGGLPYDPAWDVLGYFKFVKQVKTAEPTWNSPQTTYVETPEMVSQQNAQAQAAQTVAEITGSITKPVVETHINDSIPFGGTPTNEPLVQTQSQAEILATLNSLNQD